MAIVQHLPLDAGPIILCELDLGDPEGVATNQGLPAATSRTMSGVIPWIARCATFAGSNSHSSIGPGSSISKGCPTPPVYYEPFVSR